MKRVLLAMSCLLVLGCENVSQSSTGGGVSGQAVTAQKIRPAATDMVVKHSHLPIDYLINIKTICRIDDLTKNRQLWQQSVGINTYLMVSTQGIKINNTWVYSKPLKKGDVYEVVLSRK
jgi:hypothetical protein